MYITSKLPDLGTTIFAVMSKMAMEHGAINLSQGFPDFPVSQELISLVNAKMVEGKNQYAPMPGLPTLLEAISKMVSNRYDYQPDVSNEITITAGATEALFAVFQGLIHSGDEVIILDPAYDSYNPAVRLSGGIPVHVPLMQPGFGVDWQLVEQKISTKTKAIVINTPHNPSGAVFSEDDIEELGRISEKNDLLIISDEVYEWLIYDNNEHKSILKYEQLRNRGVAIYSFGKTFHATGWKIGYTIAPENITKEIRKAHQFITFSVNTPIQHALADFIRNPEYYKHLPAFFQNKRDFLINRIKESRFEIVPCKGTYFQLLSFRNISDKSDIEMAEWLTKEHKLASIPISVFYNSKQDHKMLRFCFAKSEDTLAKAAEILCKI